MTFEVGQLWKYGNSVASYWKITHVTKENVYILMLHNSLPNPGMVQVGETVCYSKETILESKMWRKLEDEEDVYMHVLAGI